MKKLFAVLFLAFAAAARAGYTYNLHNCEQVTLEKALYRGEVWNGSAFAFVKLPEAGDTIVLPAGSATWGTLTEHSQDRRTSMQTAGVTVRGQGDTTVITISESAPSYLTPVLVIMADNCTIGYIKFIMPVAHDASLFSVTGSNVRITHITRIQSRNPDTTPGAYSGAGYFLYQVGVTGTLIDNCTITSEVGNDEWIYTRGPTNAWQSASPIGTSQYDVFVEDCTFNGTGYSDANANARHVFRFNVITGDIKLDAHGVASNFPPRSSRSVEYYGNSWSNASMGPHFAMEIRGGTAMVFNNSSVAGGMVFTDYIATSMVPNSATITYNQGSILVTQARAGVCNVLTPVDHPFVTGMAVMIRPFGNGGTIPYTDSGYVCTRIDSRNFEIPYTLTNGSEMVESIGLIKTPYDWPLADQIGNGRDGYAREPAYVWGNTQGGSAWARRLREIPAAGPTTYKIQTGNPSATYTEADIIATNRDIFASAGFGPDTGVSVGTKAAMDAYTPSVVGYGWWVTDEGSWNTRLPPNTSGRLYKWNGSSWVLFYTPYTYPHPLQTSTEVAQPYPSSTAGTYEYAQSVTLAVSPSGSTIRYTLDGTTPSQSVGTIYTGAISISSSATLKAIGYKTGLNDSPIMEAAYVITGQVKAPTSNKKTTEYHGDQSVILDCTTSGATIYYTTDGSTPTASSTAYSGAFTVSRTTTVKAIAIKGGLADSDVLTVGITILLEVGNWDDSTGGYDAESPGPTQRTGVAYFTANVSGNLTRVSIFGTNTSATLDLDIALYYDSTETMAYQSPLTKVSGTPTTFSNVGTWTNSWKHFDVNFPVTVGHKYWIMIHVSESSALSIKSTFSSYTEAFRWGGSGFTFGGSWADPFLFNVGDGWKYTVKGMLTESGSPQTVVERPIASTLGGVFTTSFSVSLSSATSGATIYYTTDGIDPTTSSQVYSTPITIALGPPGTTRRTIKAIAVKGGMLDSVVTTEIYDMFVGQAGFVVSTLNVGTLNIQ